MITGSMVALVTPMLEDNSIDWDRLHALVEWHIESGTDAIVPVGTTGESPTVTPEEHCEIIRIVTQLCSGRIPVIAGTGANSTQEAIEFTASAKDSGAEACLLVTPYYNKPTQQGLFLHYKAIAEAVDLPQILYNVPARTGVDLLPETVHRLMDIRQVIGIKEATGDLERMTQIRTLCGDDMAIYSGDDLTACDLLNAGAKGTISVTANVAPTQMKKMVDAAMTGEQELAMRLNEPLLGLHRSLFVESNPIPLKWVLAEMGLIEEGIRLPLTRLSKKYHPELRAALRLAGLNLS
jgi:4-hydroxy-tetrahydrodipicolinate synthase